MANQLINQQWVFGNGARLDFSTAPPTASAAASINTLEGCASVSDASGQLLFYTDGVKVWDSTGTEQATSLHGNSSSTQSAIIVPDPGKAKRYYVFTADGATGLNNHFDGIRLDIATTPWIQTPLWTLTAQPTTSGLSPTERVTAIQHANCVDYWVLTVVQQGATNPGQGIVRTFLVNANGVYHISDTPLSHDVWDLGYLKANPSGSRVALANAQSSEVLLYDFDAASGTLDVGSLVVIPVPPIPAVPNHNRLAYGVEFSPNGNVLYYSILGTPNTSSPDGDGYVFQVDLSASIPASTEVIHHLADGVRYSVGALQRGIDGLIYVAKDQESSVGAILKPNLPGTACSPDMSFMTLAAGTNCFLGLPNLLPNPCDCPCAAAPCQDEVNQANQILNNRANKKQSILVANGQTVPAGCTPAFTPASFAPGFVLRWGDGPTDQFESNDLEVIYIEAYNPFSNVVFRNVTVFNITITPNQTFPSGDDAVRIIPSKITCFDEIPPCSYVARDFALIIDQAIVGTYHIAFDYCIEEIAIVSGANGQAVFDINVVAS